MKRMAFVVVLMLAAQAAASAQLKHRSPGEAEMDPLAQLLFPPELVMQQQRHIALRPEQRTSITRAMQELQARVLELQWQMQDESQRLGELLEKPTVDQTAALAQVDKVLNVEREVKRAHLGMLIQVKNALTAEQQAQLRRAMGRDSLPR